MDVFQIVRVVFIVCSVIQHSASADTTGDDVTHDVSMVTAEQQQQQQPMISIVKPIYMMMSTEATVELNYRIPCQEGQQQITVSASSLSEEVFRVHGNVTMVLKCAMEVNLITNTSGESETSMTKYSENANPSGAFYANGSLTIRLYGELIGLSKLAIQIQEPATKPLDYNSTTLSSASANQDALPQQPGTYMFPVAVMRQRGAFDLVWRFVIGGVIIVITMGFGCKLDLGVVKECIKKPIAPGIGFFCQYLTMPLIAFAITKIVPINSSSVAFGLFVTGTCPGGGMSNIYTLLLDGDVSLSITMTFISTIASVAMMPLWLYTLGKTYVTDDFKIVIPYVNMAQVIATILIPLVLGILLKIKFPKAAIKFIRILKPATIVIMFIMIGVGTYANWYIFQLFRTTDILAGAMLPYFGYLIGGGVAALLGQPKERVITIALETGMQNMAIALLLILLSFPPPIGDLSAVAPMASALMTPFPPLLLVIAYIIYRKCFKKYEVVNVEDPEVKISKEKNGSSKDEEKEKEKLTIV